ncbi:MAG: septum formation protein Maf [Xanthomonadales bacterium]|nr:septum formation protein Maf [Xanthomonadales bacterium]
MSIALPRLLLGSTSRYRAALLGQLQLDFECDDPAVIETEINGEAPPMRALRLAQAKASAVWSRSPDSVVIGSDQVAALGEQILHKPGSVEAQREQLLRSQGRLLTFYTAVCVIGPSGQSSHLDQTRCRLRALDAAAVERYVAAEPATDCAGGFKIEGLGISLFESVQSEDPSALVGLPLIALVRMLSELGWRLP